MRKSEIINKITNWINKNAEEGKNLTVGLYASTGSGEQKSLTLTEEIKN